MKLNCLKFVRYGGLSPVRQYGYKSDLFHSPPAKYGFYCFPLPFVEKFLLGGDTYSDPKNKTIKNSTNRIRYLKDKDGNIIDSNHAEYEKYSEQNKYWSFPRGKDSEGYPEKHVLYENFSRKVFSYKGNIWCHFNAKPELVLKRNKSWVLLSYTNYLKSLQKEFANCSMTMWTYYKVRSPHGFSKDHFECFIERL